jgi:hypothetical protein
VSCGTAELLLSTKLAVVSWTRGVDIKSDAPDFRYTLLFNNGRKNCAHFAGTHLLESWSSRLKFKKGRS